MKTIKTFIVVLAISLLTINPVRAGIFDDGVNALKIILEALISQDHLGDLSVALDLLLKCDVLSWEELEDAATSECLAEFVAELKEEYAYQENPDIFRTEADVALADDLVNATIGMDGLAEQEFNSIEARKEAISKLQEMALTSPHVKQSIDVNNALLVQVATLLLELKQIEATQLKANALTLHSEIRNRNIKDEFLSESEDDETLEDLLDQLGQHGFKQ